MRESMLPRMHVQRLSGHEPIKNGHDRLEGAVLDFWRWAASDLVSNTFRGWFAEYLVARALGIHLGIRRDWLAYDLKYGPLRLEIKTSAYIQSWRQTKVSVPRFSVRRARGWNPETNRMTETASRASDAYVFCLHHHQDQETLDPLDATQWSFYIVETRKIDAALGDQRSVGLGTLGVLGATPIDFSGLKAELGLVQDALLA